jgi:hypothetical protein
MVIHTDILLHTPPPAVLSPLCDPTLYRQARLAPGNGTGFVRFQGPHDLRRSTAARHGI